MIVHDMRITRLVIANLLGDDEQIKAVYADVDEAEDPDRDRALIAVAAIEMLAGYAIELHGSAEDAVAYLRAGILNEQAGDDT